MSLAQVRLFREKQADEFLAYVAKADEREIVRANGPAPCRWRLVVRQRFAAGEAGLCAEGFLDAQELVVFGDAVGAGGGAGLDLAGAHGDDEIGDEGVFGFAGAVRNDGRVAWLCGPFRWLRWFR